MLKRYDYHHKCEYSLAEDAQGPWCKWADADPLLRELIVARICLGELLHNPATKGLVEPALDSVLKKLRKPGEAK